MTAIASLFGAMTVVIVHWVLYGHPHSADDGRGSQSRAAADRLLHSLSEWKRDGRIRVVLPREVVDCQPEEI